MQQGILRGNDTALDRRGFLHLRFGRLGKSLAECAQLSDISWLELGITSGQVLQGGVEPLLLVIGMTTDDTALHDLLEQLVTGILIRRVRRDIATRTKLGLDHFLWVVRRNTGLVGVSGSA